MIKIFVFIFSSLLYHNKNPRKTGVLLRATITKSVKSLGQNRREYPIRLAD